MSNIKVWIGTEGRWSKNYSGLDKVHIIKEAIVFMCHEFNDDDIDVVLKDIEIDAREIEVSFREYHPESIVEGVVQDEFVWWGELEKLNHIQIASARILKLPLSLFEKMAALEKTKGHIFAAYKDLFKAAKVPDPIPEGYCLLFGFEEE